MFLNHFRSQTTLISSFKMQYSKIVKTLKIHVKTNVPLQTNAVCHLNKKNEVQCNSISTEMYVKNK